MPVAPLRRRSLPSSWPRVRALGSVVLAALGGLFLIVALAAFLAGNHFGYDFAAYLAASERLASGGGLYQPETLAGPFRPGPQGLYLYPPPLAALLLPLVDLGLRDAANVWAGFKLALFAATFAILPVSRRVRLVVFATSASSAPVLIDFNLGNVSLVVLFLAALAWRWLRSPARASGVLAVSWFLRPTLVVALAASALQGGPRSIVAAAATALGVIALTLPLVGVDAYPEYLRVAGNVTELTGVPRNVDLGSAALLLGAPPALAPVLLASGYATALLALLAAIRRRDTELTFIVSLGGSLLLSPLLWVHYLALLALPAAFLAARGRVWGVLLPLLGWLPEPLLPLAALLATLAPLLGRADVTAAGAAAVVVEGDPVADRRQAATEGARG